MTAVQSTGDTATRFGQTVEPRQFLPVKQMLEGAILPKYQTVGAAGFDLHVHIAGDGYVVLKGYERAVFDTGLAFQIPEGYEMQIRSRSGASINSGIIVTNQPATIDSDYRGHVKLAVTNLDSWDKTIWHGDRLAQGVVAPVVQMHPSWVGDLTPTERNDNGFGSTGK